MRATTTTLLGLISLSIHLTLSLAKHSSSSSKNNGDTVFNPERNKSINACDSPDGTLVNRKNNGKAVAWDPNGVIPVEQSDDPIFFLSPGESACGFNYTDADAGACLDPGWIDGGYINVSLRALRRGGKRVLTPSCAEMQRLDSRRVARPRHQG